MSSADSTLDVGRPKLLRTQYLRRNGALLVDIRWWLLRTPTDAEPYLAPGIRGMQFPASHITQVIAALNRIRDQMICEGVLEVEEGRPERFRPEVHDRDF